MKQHHAGAIAGGLSLLLIGGWFLTRAVSLLRLTDEGHPPALLDSGRVWPGLFILFGLFLLVEYWVESRDKNSLLFLGSLSLLLGPFLCFFSLQVARFNWADLEMFWPVFLLIISSAFLSLYLVSGIRQQTFLVPVYLIGGVGLFALPFTMKLIPGETFTQVLQLWPIPLVMIILVFFFRQHTPELNGDRFNE